jgi:hypothetical protein
MRFNQVNDINRKLHIHLGLALLFFVWLFALTGLLLNHGDWKFASFWPERKETTTNFVMPPSLMRDLSERAVMEFLNTSGEIQQPRRTDQTLEFRITSPGKVRDIAVDLTTGAGSEKRLTFNLWGKLRTMHTFNGMNKEYPVSPPNWWITNLWRFAMDVIALGLIVICLSSWMMWYKVRKEYALGYAILVGSFLLLGYFLLS